jgi:hypothetical protein
VREKRRTRAAVDNPPCSPIRINQENPKHEPCT